ncbi:MAG: hypothetical protein ABI609_08385, partial [Acidobacteriota bacterium]
AGEGLNDPTPVAPVFGNSGTTRGQQRKNALQAAANYWGAILQDNVTIRVDSSFDPKTCTPTSALLGSAGAIGVVSDFPGAPKADTWYPLALANAIAGSDQDPSSSDIRASFNSTLDNGSASCIGGLKWFYGIGIANPSGTLGFFSTAKHEFAHGLGFQTFVNPLDGSRFQDTDDTFMDNLEDHSLSKRWDQLNDGQRAASSIDTGDLHWLGANVVAASSVLSAGRHPSGHVRMYAPNPVEVGSSVSHWDTVLSPDELMEPIDTPTEQNLLDTQAFKDIGWSVQQVTGPCVRSAGTACLAGGRFEVKVDWQSATDAGTGQVMFFGAERAENNDSAFYWFFASTNFEIGLKVLDACGLNSKFWVFISGLTNQGWTVHVRDTVSGQTKTYANALNHLTSTVADTAAFSCP